MKHSLNLANLQSQIHDCLDALQNFLVDRPEQNLKANAAELQRQRHEHSKRTLLSLAFSGQFSAGKSTIISALTGNDEIKISADVATNQVNSYAWRSIELWDTPGLYSNRPDHDQKAATALREADLVVYCLTTNLFDEVTAHDFHSLAFEQGYAGKLFLLINKLSMEDANDTDLYIQNLKSSLDSTLAPRLLSDFPHAFIDAQDYREGIAMQNPELVAFSRFEGFIGELNRWVEQKGILARLDPPIRLGLNIIEEIFQSLPEQSFTDNPELFLINQQLRIVQNQRQRTENEVKRIGRSTSHKIELLGEQLLSGEYGAEQEACQDVLQRERDEINANAFDELNEILSNSYDTLVEKLKEFANEQYVADYYASVDADSVHAVPNNGEKAQGPKNAIKGVLKSLVEQGTQNVLKSGGVKKGFFYSSKQVAGGNVHKVIYEGGKFFGTKFKPYQAVRLAKGVGNAMAFIGIGIAIYEVVDVVKDGIEAEKRERQREQERNKFRNEIAKIGRQMSDQLLNTYKCEFDQLIISDIVNHLTRRRDEILVEQYENTALVERLTTYRQQLNQLVAELYKTEI